MTAPEPDEPATFDAQLVVTATAYATHPDGAVVPVPAEENAP